MSERVGIDFGTTYCCIARKDSKGLRIITNGYNKPIFPTTISVRDGVWDVGRHDITSAPGAWTVINGVKRVIGRDSRDPKLELDIRKLGLPFQLQEGKPCANVDGKNLTPLEIVTLIFMKAKQNYERETGDTAGLCVLTVPAYFTGQQCQCVELAAKIAGWEPSRIVNEPTAVAVAELSDRHEDGEYLIVDCGGGTLDCAVVSLKEKMFAVLASSGDNALGGYDFLRAMADIVSAKFPNARGNEVLSACENAMDMRMLKDEILRIDLGDESYNLPMTEFTAACNDIHSRIKDTLSCLRPTLDRLKQKLPEKVILAGGATRNPIFSDLVRQVFGDEVKFLKLSAPGSEIVARGAAIMAADGTPATEILGRSLGIDTQSLDEGCQDIMQVLLRRHAALPASCSASFKAVHDEETEIILCEGESAKSSENIFLDKISIRARSGEDIQVDLLVDNATVVVRAVGANDDKEKAVTRSSTLPEAVIQEIRRQAEERFTSSAKEKTGARTECEQTGNKRAGAGDEGDKNKAGQASKRTKR